MIPTSHEVIVFTDGSSRGNPGPGGYAAVIVYKLGSWEVKEVGGREEHTTNNRMELTAAIKALEFVSSLNAKRLTLYADSSYLINGITRWVHEWQKNGWKTKTKQDVENTDLWEKLIETSRNKEIEWKQVEGHAGVAGNQRCDEIATAFADGKNPRLYSDVLKNYSIKNILDVPRGLPRTDLGSAERSVLGRQKKRSRSRATAYSYVSMINGVIQTHQTWAECEARVKWVRGAKYKKVSSPEEERLLIAEWQRK